MTPLDPKAVGELVGRARVSADLYRNDSGELGGLSGLVTTLVETIEALLARVEAAERERDSWRHSYEKLMGVVKRLTDEEPS